MFAVCLQGKAPDSAYGRYPCEHHYIKKPAHLGAELVHPSAVNVDVQHAKIKRTTHHCSAITRGKGRGFRIAA